MIGRLFRHAAVLALATLVTAAVPAAAAKVYRAEQFDVRLEVRPGGSLLVTETIRFAFGPDSFTYVSREVPERRTDGVTYVGASMDGVPMTRGDGPGQFEVRKRDNGRRRVVFHFAMVTASAHTFTLTYEARGVVRQEAGADLLSWQILPTDHNYVIDRASAEIVYPTTTTLLDVTGADADGGTVRATRTGIGPDGEWPITLRFAPRTLVAAPPAWQLRQIRTRENMPLFLGLAGLLVMTGAGGILLFRRNNRPEFADDGETRAAAPPDRLPVCLAGAITSNWIGVTWNHAMGSILDLARRGVLRIEANPDPGLFTSKPFLLRRTNTAPMLAGHEQALVDILFTTKKGRRDTLSFSELTSAVSSSRNWKRFSKTVTADSRAAGLIDPDRERLRSRLTVLGVGVLIAFVPALIMCVLLLERVGGAVLSLPVALLAVGITAFGAAATFNVLSAEGQRRARAARGYERHLADLSRQRSASSAATAAFEQALPYAAAFGLAVGWAKHLEKQGVTSGPAWLGALAQEATRSGGHMAATVAMLSAGSNAGAHAGGGAAAAGAAGAAGGGASSAG